LGTTTESPAHHTEGKGGFQSYLNSCFSMIPQTYFPDWTTSACFFYPWSFCWRSDRQYLLFVQW